MPKLNAGFSHKISDSNCGINSKTTKLRGNGDRSIRHALLSVRGR